MYLRGWRRDATGDARQLRRYVPGSRRNGRLLGDDGSETDPDDGSVLSDPTPGDNVRAGRPTIASAVAVLGLSLAVAACGSGNGSEMVRRICPDCSVVCWI